MFFKQLRIDWRNRILDMMFKNSAMQFRAKQCCRLVSALSVYNGRQHAAASARSLPTFVLVYEGILLIFNVFKLNMTILYGEQR